MEEEDMEEEDMESQLQKRILYMEVARLCFAGHRSFLLTPSRGLSKMHSTLKIVVPREDANSAAYSSAPKYDRRACSAANTPDQESTDNK
jgi:hypothetical protein